MTLGKQLCVTTRISSSKHSLSILLRAVSPMDFVLPGFGTTDPHMQVNPMNAITDSSQSLDTSGKRGRTSPLLCALRDVSYVLK